MDETRSIALALFVVVTMFACCAYIHSVKTSFTIDKDHFDQAGVMEYHDNGNTVYIPVFTKRK